MCLAKEWSNSSASQCCLCSIKPECCYMFLNHSPYCVQRKVDGGVIFGILRPHIKILDHVLQVLWTCLPLPLKNRGTTTTALYIVHRLATSTYGSFQNALPISPLMSSTGSGSLFFWPSPVFQQGVDIELAQPHR